MPYEQSLIKAFEYIEMAPIESKFNKMGLMLFYVYTNQALGVIAGNWETE